MLKNRFTTLVYAWKYVKEAEKKFFWGGRTNKKKNFLVTREKKDDHIQKDFALEKKEIKL